MIVYLQYKLNLTIDSCIYFLPKQTGHFGRHQLWCFDGINQVLALLIL